MSLTRAKDLNRAAAWFHALSDETRLRIIEYLSDGEQCVCDLTDILHTGQSRLSFHLKTLKEAGILKDRREGRWIYYSLDPETVEEIAEWVRSLQANVRRAPVISKCCD